jgi:predicted phage terminase large subunit-like protein
MSRTNARSGSAKPYKAGTPRTKRPSSAITAFARPGVPMTIGIICWMCFGSGWITPDLKRKVQELAKLDRPHKILIEDRASGTQLIQELKAEGLYAVTAYQPPSGTDKIMRLYAQTATFENGRVLLPSRASWLSDYINELTSFPGARHDDQVDSTTQALDHLRTYERASFHISPEALARARIPRYRHNRLY